MPNAASADTVVANEIKGERSSTNEGSAPGTSTDTTQKGAMFDVFWAEPVTRSVRAQSLVVDIDTGEVWDPGRCERVSTPALEAAQRVIRRL